jgi:hypothetical protein
LRLKPSELEKLFEHLRYDETSKTWKGKTEASRRTGISRPTIDKVLVKFPRGLPESLSKSKQITPQFVDKYEKTETHRKLVASYTDRATGKLSRHGANIDSMGLELYLMFGQTDPLTLDLKDFLKAWNDPMFVDRKTGTIAFAKASSIRVIMAFAGIDPKRYKELTTKGIKREPQQKSWYLEEVELLKYIYGINEVDTLLFCRIGFEAGGRFSSTVLTSTDKIAFELGMIEMREPKVGKIEERYFSEATMSFLRQYIKDFSVIGKLFRWGYEEGEKRLLAAGQRAGLFRYTGQSEVRDVRVKGKVEKRRIAMYEGKKTSSHLLKHTFVSLASLHGFGLDDVSEQTGTDPSTLKKFYLGVGKKKLQGLIQGKVDYVPWNDWVTKTLDPHWKARYNQLKPLAQKVDGFARTA